MPYSYREIPESEHEDVIVEMDGDAISYPDTALSGLTHRIMNQYEILDEQGDQICVVYSEIDAETLITHLNR